jgi:hypothetical protein
MPPTSPQCCATGVLQDDQVTRVTVENSRQTLISTIRHLRLDLNSAAPALRLFLKTRRADSTITVPESREAAFYRLVAPLSPPDLFPRCFDAVDGGAAGWYILLEDLTDSHEVVSEWPIPATMEQCERIISAHARFHAAWWDHPRLGHGVGTFIDERDFDRIMKEFSRHFAAFVDRLGDRLPAERRRVVERLMADASRLFAERYHSHQRLTIVHGDAHVWNALYPRDPARTDVRLIDWDGWRIDVATDDLAYMIALHWFPDRRRRFERRCLEHYHAILVQGGVCAYDFDALWLDYRLSVLWQVLTPIWQAGIKLGPWIWFGHFERIMMAVDDLDCLELLA